ncbi:MAG: ankyrin repeat domain-containing protein [Acidobacteriia bacterium]|nr:ankyrin repeat domain-containing protein [Terriglobia bacterium]
MWLTKIHAHGLCERLSKAIEANDVGEVDILLRKGANPNAGPSAERSPLMRAAEKGNAKIVELLLAKGARVNFRQDWRHSSDPLDGYKATALLCAVRAKHSDIVAMLLEHGADPNLRGQDGTTPLLAAGGSLSIIQALVTAGADVNARHDSGETALYIAAFNSEAVEYLLECGADVNAQSHATGRTPLMRAAISGNAEAVRLLLRHGADPTLRAPGTGVTSGGTALDFAANEETAIEIRRAILSHGAFHVSGPSLHHDHLEGRIDELIALRDLDGLRQIGEPAIRRLAQTMELEDTQLRKFASQALREMAVDEFFAAYQQRTMKGCSLVNLPSPLEFRLLYVPEEGMLFNAILAEIAARPEVDLALVVWPGYPRSFGGGVSPADVEALFPGAAIHIYSGENGDKGINTAFNKIRADLSLQPRRCIAAGPKCHRLCDVLGSRVRAEVFFASIDQYLLQTMSETRFALKDHFDPASGLTVAVSRDDRSLDSTLRKELLAWYRSNNVTEVMRALKAAV